MAESKGELKSLLMKVKDESEKFGLKLSIQKIKIMASCSITLWQIDGEAMETVTDFIFLGSKITEDGDYSHEIKRCLDFSWKKNYDQPRQHIKKRDIPLPTKVHLVYGFSSSHIWSWIIKKAEHQRIDAFKLWCWRRLLSPLECKEIKLAHPKGN